VTNYELFKMSQSKISIYIYKLSASKVPGTG